MVSGAVQGAPVLDVVSAGSVGFRASTLSADASDAAVVGVNYGGGPGGVFTGSHSMNGIGVRGFGGDVGVYGSKLIPTPNIDKLARGGLMFTDSNT